MIGILCLGARAGYADDNEAGSGPETRLEEGLAAFEEGWFQQALELLKPSADDGVPVALHRVGKMHGDGLGVPEDPALAAELFRAAADRAAVADPQDGITYRRAVYDLARQARLGQGQPIDLDRAECFYRIAADMGDPEAQWELFRLLTSLPGISLSAGGWLDRAVRQGHTRSMAFRGITEVMNPYGDFVRGYTLFLIARERDEALGKSNWDLALSFEDAARVDGLALAKMQLGNWRAILEAPPARFHDQQNAC